MTTPIAPKLAALGIALIMNAIMLGTVGYLFDGQLDHSPVRSMAHSVASHAANPKA